MNKAFLKHVHPVLPVKNVTEAINYYIDRLGFNLAFKDLGDDPKYGGVVRDGIELHLQWHSDEEWKEGLDALSLRIYVDEVDLLFEEYQNKNVFHEHTSLKNTPWRTREFAFYDLSKNGLTFYKDL
ncbi:glyoxalase/bleomycin resistance/extradiol dioxygenase family protein [Ichthyenterobacterium sp. W332]|uniref:Glyoxalase/bleomycin resistance/extradiol dioxygenase family protein n=1 Tax=Microcosmobacter mediterraneus TaxID=3075607 RepID=A0ABU2YIK4_9FLAO|nr:VOC family protein [Ichthyenterobacterium sp. W332]MDT0557065.1 glyoxalase/bleomycin resistance/extradiol dioxygenase family protein [Ichthyenterobacterium sp. W332]